MSQLRGKYEDMGDVVIHTEWLLKGGKNWRMLFHTGPHLDLPASQRPDPRPPTYTANPGRIDQIMDLGADKKVALATQFTDEIGHPVEVPATASVVYSVDNTEVIALTDNGDGTAVAAATGVLGNAVVTATATFQTGVVHTGDLLISVVPGEAERVTIVAGEITEVTPDEPPAGEEPAPEPTPEG